MARCKTCNDRFERIFGYDAEHCDEWCARATDPSITTMQQELLNQPKESLFNYYLGAFKGRARSVTKEEAEEKILKSEEYIRLRLRFQKAEGR